MKKREYLPENFSPMFANSRLWETAKKNNVQVLIDYLGKKVWINMPIDKIKEGF